VEDRRESGGMMMGRNDRQNEIVPPSTDSKNTKTKRKTKWRRKPTKTTI
jgi:hypothetical protein